MSWVRRNWLPLYVTLCLTLIPLLAWAHPGRTDSCGGHTVSEPYEYTACTPSATGHAQVECSPSEAGEYHLHVSAEEMNEQVMPSLAEYRRTHPSSTSLGIDLGSFTMNGRTYDIWEYTRNGEAIIHCRDDENVLHTGIMRVK